MTPCGAPRGCGRMGANPEPRLLGGYRCACPRATGRRRIGVGSGKVTRCLAWLTKRNDYGTQGHEEDGGAEAWCERVGIRVAGGGGHLDTHQSVRRS